MQLECISITEQRGGDGLILHFNNPATPGGSLELRVGKKEGAFATVGTVYECALAPTKAAAAAQATQTTGTQGLNSAPAQPKAGQTVGSGG